MATKALKIPLIRQVTTRGYAQAAPAVSKNATIQSAVLPNKVIAAAVDNGSPLTRVTIAFKAGCRYEPASELGISHVLRSAAGLTTQNASSFILARKLQQIGASVSASGDREFVYYTLEATQDQLHTAIECLTNLVTNQEFRPWELSDNIPKLKYEIAALAPQVRAVDLLHKAAFRRSLGNSLFISPKKIGKISSESLQHYASNTLTFDRCAVTVVGDNLDSAKSIAQTLQLTSGGSASNQPSKYFTGELRKEMGGDLAHVALALAGAPAGSQQAIALAIAAKAFGNGPVTKWGADNSLLGKAIGNIGPFAAAGFNVSYSDTGLFGVVLSVPKDEAYAAVKGVGTLLKNPNLSPEAIKAGKNQLKVQILHESEEGASLSETLAAQSLYTGSVKSPGELAAIVDQVSNSEIASVLSSVASQKFSLGAAGNLSTIPFVDEI